MKNTIIVLIFLAFFTINTFAGVIGIKGNRADWGVSHTTTNAQVVAFLQQNWKEGNQLSLQSKIDKQGLDCEFLWKVTSDLVDEAVKSNSSFLTGEKADSITMVFEASGKTKITLYSQGKLVGRVRAWTSSKRTGKEFYQLAAGEYRVTDKDPNGTSKNGKTKMPNKVVLDGSALQRGISIHTGDISGQKPGINEYHGCIRVSDMVGQQFMKIIPEGTIVKVVWK